MEILIREGANVKGSVLGAIGQHNFEAAKYLLSRGATYNLATAAGLEAFDDVKSLSKNATPSELYVALVVASFLGKARIAALLIEAGADVNGYGTPEDFDGFHSHAGPLHQAVSSASLDLIKLLVRAGADLSATDKIFNGTPLEWTTYIQAEQTDEVRKKQYEEIKNYLAAESRA